MGPAREKIQCSCGFSSLRECQLAAAAGGRHCLCNGMLSAQSGVKIGEWLHTFAAEGNSVSRNWAHVGPARGDGAPDDWLIWQLVDSALPTGGFAHSGGVEAAWQFGHLRAPPHLAAFLRDALRQAAHGGVPFLNAVFADHPVDVADAHLDAMLASHVANRASRLQGRALAATAERVFPAVAPIKALRDALVADLTPGHLPVVFAAVTRAVGVPHARAVRMYLFTTLRGAVSAAVRLGAVGPLAAQQLQAELAASGELEAIAVAAERLTPDDAAQTAPLLELWQGAQDRLYSRLFQS
jgi:urease accessory protein